MWSWEAIIRQRQRGLPVASWCQVQLIVSGSFLPTPCSSTGWTGQLHCNRFIDQLSIKPMYTAKIDLSKSCPSLKFSRCNFDKCYFLYSNEKAYCKCSWFELDELFAVSCSCLGKDLKEPNGVLKHNEKEQLHTMYHESQGFQLQEHTNTIC